jgi:superfamily II DNA or RNA helicase
MLPLYQHQQEVIDNDPKIAPIALGVGGGKTRLCLELAEGKTLIIVPKQQKLDKTWEENAEKFGIDKEIKVLSKEEFKKVWETLGYYDTIIIDECHYHLGTYPDTVKRNGEMVPKSSQLFEAVYKFIQKHPPKRFYPTSATPISKPMNLWALATLMGYKWNFYEFRDIYYSPIRMGFRTMWAPKKGDKIKERLARSFKKLGAITGRLQDWFDVPEQTEIEKYFELTTEQKKAITEMRMTEPDKMSVMTKSRAIENGILYYDRPTVTGEKTISMKRDTKIFPSEKIDYILERALEFDKLLIFANYIGQIEYIEQALKDEGYIVFTLTGQTKKREDVIATAQRLKKCIVIAQASVSSGYELPDFPCCIFASKSYKALDLEQGKGRILRAGHLKKNLYIHLIIRDGIDEKCHKTVMSGMDFQEKLYD